MKVVLVPVWLPKAGHSIAGRLEFRNSFPTSPYMRYHSETQATASTASLNERASMQRCSFRCQGHKLFKGLKSHSQHFELSLEAYWLPVQFFPNSCHVTSDRCSLPAIRLPHTAFAAASVLSPRRTLYVFLEIKIQLENCVFF